MAEVLDDSENKWLNELQEELSKDVVDSHESMMNKRISTVYSGPTISDIENALAWSFKGNKMEGRSREVTAIWIADKGKMDNKYTLKIKSCGNGGIAGDGYKWRKYGQKFIKNIPNPRSYYRCTNRRCNAKKQVERSMEDPETLIVTYEGIHRHCEYSHFLPRPQNSVSTHVPKKPKLQNPSSDNRRLEDRHKEDRTESKATTKMEDNPQEELLKDAMIIDPGIREECMQHDMLIEEEQSTRGLLEDIVPLLVRKPCSSTVCSNEPSSSRVSSPSYSSSYSWSPTDFYFDVGILSSIV